MLVGWYLDLPSFSSSSWSPSPSAGPGIFRYILPLVCGAAGSRPSPTPADRPRLRGAQGPATGSWRGGFETISPGSLFASELSSGSDTIFLLEVKKNQSDVGL